MSEYKKSAVRFERLRKRLLVFSLFIATCSLLIVFVSCDGNFIVRHITDKLYEKPCEHNWQLTLKINPTCTINGHDIFTCILCNETENRNIVSALGHLATGSTPATCTTPGNTGTGVCTRAGCGETVTGDPIPINPTNHTGGETNGTTVPATCKATGTQQILCGGCNAQLRIETLAINSSNHTGGEKNGPTIPATCSVTGTQQILCVSCNALLRTDILPIDPSNHSGSSFSTATCDGCSSEANIGDIGPGGGRIFHKDTVGFTVQGYEHPTNPAYSGNFSTYTAHYLEVAPANVISSMQPWSEDFSSTDVPIFTDLTSPRATEIGNGRLFSHIISVRGLTGVTPAARRCIQYTNNGKDDWFLPSLGELNLLYQNRVAVGFTSTDTFWSSSQYSSVNNTWYIDFSNGDRLYSGRSIARYIRAIRAF